MNETDEGRARAADEADPRQPRREGVAPEMEVREEDLEPHAGLRYIARLFKVLAILLLLLLIAEIVIGILAEGQAAVATLMIEATRLIVFAGLLWGLGDMALMLIESNHDLRATRILVGRLNGRVSDLAERIDLASAYAGGASGAVTPSRPTSSLRPPPETPAG